MAMLRCRMGSTGTDVDGWPEVHVRRVEQPDLPDLRRMVTALAAHHGDTARASLGTLAGDVLGDAPWLTLVAEVDGSLVGYAASCPPAQTHFGLRRMYLHQLYVDPDVRGSGIGRRLIEASTSLAQALGCNVIVVGSKPDDHAAQAVYAACGFEALPCDGSHFWKKMAPPQDANV